MTAPSSVAIGWSLATPAKPSSEATALPGGAGGFGNAPAREAGQAPDTPIRYATRPQSPLSASSRVVPPVPPSVVTPTRKAPAFTAPTAPPSATPSTSFTPELTDPPVPTPTDPDGPDDPIDPSDDWQQPTGAPESTPETTPPSLVTNQFVNDWGWWNRGRHRRR